MVGIEHFLSPNSILTTTALSPEIVGPAGYPSGYIGFTTIDQPVIAVSPDQPLALSFQNTLKRDLEAGVINKLLGVSEPLTFVRDKIAGDADLHAYFTVGNLKWAPAWTQFDLTFMVKGSDGNAYPETRRYVVEDGSPSAHGRMKPIDSAGVSIIQAEGERLFQSRTRKVVFQGGGKEHSAYYKFTPSYRVEDLACRFLSEIGISTPGILYSTTPNAFWMREIKGDTFGDLIQSVLCSRFLDYLAINYRGDPVAVLDFIGDVSMAMYLLGNTDVHHFNYILGEGNGCHALDLETAGMPELYGWDTIPDPSHFVQYCHGEGTSKLFSSVNERSYSVPRSLHDDILRVRDGARGVFRSMARRAVGFHDGISSLEGTLYPRMLLLGTWIYLAREISPIPHYTFAVDTRDFAAMFKKRFDIARAAYGW